MIRLVQRKLIIPRGDTGSFTIPTIAAASQSDVAVFTVFDRLTQTKIFQKTVPASGDNLTITFTHNDTVNLKPGKYVWDIKFYKNPQYVNEELVNGDEIDSYYAGYSLPDCEIRETGDNLLVSSDAAQGALSPEQLDIISAALASLNDAIDKTADNVAHYPQIRDEEWYVWSAEANDFVATGVRANGIVGNGIESAVVNNDYTLTLNFTDGTSYTSGSIRGAVGNGIEDVILNNDYTLTITFTDGTSYTTPSIRGMVGATPQFSIGTVQEGASAAATITGTAEAPVLNLTLPNANVPTKVSELENDANYAVDANYVHTDNNYTTEEKTKLSGIAEGAEVNVNADWDATEGDAFIRNKPTSVSSFTNDAGYLTAETDPTVPEWAKAAQKPSYTAAEVGAPTVAEMQQAIANVNTMKIHICAQGEYNSETGVPTIQNPDTQTFYLVPGGENDNLFIEWVYVNGAWEQFGSASVDLSGYATKEEVPVERGTGIGSVKTKDFTDGTYNYVSTASGMGGIALGANAYATGAYSVAIGQNAHATGDFSYAEGCNGTTASGSRSHAEGNGTEAIGTTTHAEGYQTIAEGNYSHTSGRGTYSTGRSSFVSGEYNVVDDFSSWPEWVASTSYNVGDKVKVTNGTSVSGYKCKIANSDAVFTSANWTKNLFINYAHIVGNGTSSTHSNAYALDWDGNGHYMGDVYVGANTDSSGGTRLPHDVQVAGASVVDANGVANVPIASTTNYGVLKIGANTGLLFDPSGYLKTATPYASEVKAGTNAYKPLTPSNQDASVFYGLTKAAGVDMASSANAVGTYTEEAKAAIKSMLGVQDGLRVVRLI